MKLVRLYLVVLIIFLKRVNFSFGLGLGKRCIKFKGIKFKEVLIVRVMYI